MKAQPDPQTQVPQCQPRCSGHQMVWLRLLAALLVQLGHPGVSLASGPLTSTDRLRQYMEQIRPQPAAGQAGSQAVLEAATVSPARLQERAELLKAGESALERRDVSAALEAFERATVILHAADTEIAMARTYMQNGEYRRALAFGAHTAGSHLDVIGGAALYAWFLHVGGQPALAQRLLAASESRMPGHPVVVAVQQQLRSGSPVATGDLLTPPTRLAPYGDATGLPENARVAGSGLLLPSGTAALVPLSLLPGSGKLWLRNGLGQLVKAKPDQRLTDLNVALVRLDSPLPVPEDFLVAAGEALPGSPGFAVQYISTPDAAPAWPVLRAGFLGGTTGDAGTRLLGIDMPAGPRGGPVFDGAGHLIGLALPGASGTPIPSVPPAHSVPPVPSVAGADTLVTVSQLRKALSAARAGEQLAVQDLPTQNGPRPRGLVDKVYEASLRSSLQVITAP